MGNQEVPHIEDVIGKKPVTPLDRWAAALAAAAVQAPPQVSHIQAAVKFFKGESDVVQRNLEATRKVHEAESQRFQKIFEIKVWQQLLTNLSLADKSLEFYPQ